MTMDEKGASCGVENVALARYLKFSQNLLSKGSQLLSGESAKLLQCVKCPQKVVVFSPVFLDEEKVAVVGCTLPSL